MTRLTALKTAYAYKTAHVDAIAAAVLGLRNYLTPKETVEIFHCVNGLYVVDTWSFDATQLTAIAVDFATLAENGNA